MTTLLYGGNGCRKYLTKEERRAFLRSSKSFSREIQTLCWLVASTGCRISEAIALTTQSVDPIAKIVVIESLKKRQKGVFRAVPIEDTLIRELSAVHAIDATGNAEPRRLWAWSRITAYRHIRDVMLAAGLRGPHAMPKGLRHGFGVTAVQSGVPLNIVQRWLGHADMRTTAIYTGAIGAEERSIAARMWRSGNFALASEEPSSRQQDILKAA